MRSFKDKLFQEHIVKYMVEDIVLKILKCSELMVEDRKKSGLTIENHEERLRDHLYYHYLNNNSIAEKVGLDNYYFVPEVPEHYVNDQPKGRVDLKVINRNTFNNRKAYLVIEFKRIDGRNNLNNAYVTEGVNRFLGDTEPPLYSSYYGRSCMFGFVVKDINIDKNTGKINHIHRMKNKVGKRASEIDKYTIDNDFPYTYLSTYRLNNNELDIYHSFYEFYSIVEPGNNKT